MTFASKLPILDNELKSAERRDFLKALSVGACATALTGTLASCGVDPSRSVAGPAADKAGLVKFAANAFKELGRVGGSAQVQSDGLGAVLVMRTGSNTYAAVSGICTHQGCPLGYNGKSVECPCHAALFTLDGVVTRGPAKTNLQKYVVTTDRVTSELVVNTRGPKYPAAVGNTLVLNVDEIRDLENNGDALTFLPIGFDRPLVVVRYQTDQFIVLDAEDTVDRGIVEYNDTTKRLISSTNGAEYDLQGAVKVPPATIALKVYPSTLGADRVLTISLG